ncbi:hypothetical protein GGR58DRAFT_503166 [Xylaria digitata]|nr:hypothetical protein GGR58DRAFT_503166 [Xylaria digitata]
MSDIRFAVYKGSPSGKVVQTINRKGQLQEHQVLIRITNSGICGTDEHYKTQDMVLGHEGVGIVEAVSNQVKSLKILPFLDLVMSAIEIQGSLPAPREILREMLRFAAFHRVSPIIEIFPFNETGIDDAMKALRDGKIRYRAVPEAS